MYEDFEDYKREIRIDRPIRFGVVYILERYPKEKLVMDYQVYLNSSSNILKKGSIQFGTTILFFVND